MSEKLQHTAATMRETMLHRYDDGLHHKHNKCHLPYRRHCRSHPSQLTNGHDLNREENESIGVIYEKIPKKSRLRIVKLRIH